MAVLLDLAAQRALAVYEAGLQGEELAAAMTLLRDVAVADPGETYDPTPYIESQHWTFAKTMPQRPHEYVHLSKSTDWREHLRFVRWLRLYGSLERFGGSLWPYRTVGAWRYWAGADPNWTIVNRRKAPVEPAPTLWEQS
jgi:hypothetical protein